MRVKWDAVFDLVFLLLSTGYVAVMFYMTTIYSAINNMTYRLGWIEFILLFIAVVVMDATSKELYDKFMNVKEK